MKTVNRFDKSFGPAGSSAGYLLLIAGIIATFTSWYGLILILPGAFMAFTSTCTQIDFGMNRIRFSDNLFGFIPTGKWIAIEQDMKLGIRESNITWTTYSRSNRSIDIENNDFRIVLFDAEDNEIMPVKKTETYDLAADELEVLCEQLKLEKLDLS